MKLRYYLRGLGIGIVVTALLVGNAKATELSDDEIRQRALRLGMIENSTLSKVNSTNETLTEEESGTELEEDNNLTVDTDAELNDDNSLDTEIELNNSFDADTDTATETVMEEVESAEVANEETLSTSASTVNIDAGTEVIDTEGMESSTDGLTDNTAETKDHVELPETVVTYLELAVKQGDSSVTVSNSLQTLGMIENSKDFDQYLCRNGYDKKICVGKYQLSADMDYETIANIITKNN